MLTSYGTDQIKLQGSNCKERIAMIKLQGSNLSDQNNRTKTYRELILAISIHSIWSVLQIVTVWEHLSKLEFISSKNFLWWFLTWTLCKIVLIQDFQFLHESYSKLHVFLDCNNANFHPEVSLSSLTGLFCSQVPLDQSNLQFLIFAWFY